MRTTLTTLILVLTSFIWGNAQTYTLEDKWVDCGNNTQLLDPYYSPGVTFTWTGSSKGGKANGQGVATKYVNGKFESKYEAPIAMVSAKVKVHLLTWMVRLRPAHL